jgi:hypothetical protein
MQSMLDNNPIAFVIFCYVTCQQIINLFWAAWFEKTNWFSAKASEIIVCVISIQNYKSIFHWNNNENLYFRSNNFEY